jgi:hypothetical protein
MRAVKTHEATNRLSEHVSLGDVGNLAQRIGTSICGVKDRPTRERAWKTRRKRAER